MIRAIAAVSQNNVFGDSKTNALPWKNVYPEDLKFFWRKTVNSTLIFGRNTLSSFGSRALPKRRNILISRTDSDLPGIETFKSVEDALKHCSGDVWMIGGLKIYEESLRLAEELYITQIPEVIKGPELIYFPKINPQHYKLKEVIVIDEIKNLKCNVFSRV